MEPIRPPTSDEQSSRRRWRPGGWALLGALGFAMVVAGTTMFAFPIDSGEDPPSTDADTSTRREGRLPAPYSSFGPGLDAEGPSFTRTAEEDDQTADPEAPLEGRVIVLDPGHNGGNDRNKRTLRHINREVTAAGLTRRCDSIGTEIPGFSESAYNLGVAQLAARQLRGMGAKVRLTRVHDTGVGPCITERAAKARSADAYISVHADEVADPGAGGFHVIYPADGAAASGAAQEASAQLAAAVRDALAGELDRAPSNYLGHEGLDQRRDVLVLNAAGIAAIVVEIGNPLNPDDAEMLADPAAQAQAAQAIALGIRQFLAPDSTSTASDR